MLSPLRIHFDDANFRIEFGELEYYNNRSKKMRISEKASMCKTFRSERTNISHIFIYRDRIYKLYIFIVYIRDTESRLTII